MLFLTLESTSYFRTQIPVRAYALQENASSKSLGGLSARVSAAWAKLITVCLFPRISQI